MLNSVFYEFFSLMSVLKCVFSKYYLFLDKNILEKKLTSQRSQYWKHSKFFPVNVLTLSPAFVRNLERSQRERAFLVDQRKIRRMFMIDSNEKVTLSSLFEKSNNPYIIKPLLTVSSEKISFYICRCSRKIIH